MILAQSPAPRNKNGQSRVSLSFRAPLSFRPPHSRPRAPFVSPFAPQINLPYFKIHAIIIEEMAVKSHHSLKSKILLLIFVCTEIITITTAMVAFQTISNVLNKDIAQKMNYHCKTIALETDQRFLHIEDTVNNVSALVKDRISSPEAFKNKDYRKSAVADIDSFFRAIALNTIGIVSFYASFDPYLIGETDGFFYTMNQKGLLEDTPLTDIRQYDKDDIEHVGWFYIPVQHERGIWMDPYLNKNVDLQMFSYVVPIFKSGTLIGIVGMDVDFKVLVESIERLTKTNNRYAFLKNAAGTVHYNLDYFDGTIRGDESIKILTNKEIMSMENSGDKIIRYKTEDGQNRVMTFDTLRNGMKLVLCDKTSDVYADRVRAVAIILTLAAILEIIFIAVTTRLTAQIIKPLELLTIAAKKITSGQLDINLPAETNDEIGVLIRAFNTTAAHLRKYTSNMETLAYQDAMTKVKNPASYKMMAENLDRQIKKSIAQFAIIMFDLNNLKQINDLHGHKAGDSAIKIAAGIICRVFPYSSVFRIGGDEFVVVLQGIEYENRSNLLVEFDKQVKENKDKAVEKYEAVSIARGMSVFDPQVDKNYQQVFERADAAMYQNKNIFHSASQMANNNTSRSPS